MINYRFYNYGRHLISFFFFWGGGGVGDFLHQLSRKNKLDTTTLISLVQTVPASTFYPQCSDI